MRIGTFRSLTNPGKKYAMFRQGREIEQGGEGTRWVCSCMGSQVYGGKTKSEPCQHLKCFWAYTKHDKLDMLLKANLVTLTQRGKDYLFRMKYGYNPTNYKKVK